MTFDLGVKVTRNVAQYSLHHVTYSATKSEGTTSNRLGGDTFTRNVTVARPHGRTSARTDRRRTDFGMKLIYPFLSKEKSGYNDTVKWDKVRQVGHGITTVLFKCM